MSRRALLSLAQNVVLLGLLVIAAGLDPRWVWQY